MTGGEGQDWRGLANHVIERRGELGFTQEDLRQRGGPSTATMRLIEGALQTSYRPAILRRLESALDWAPGSVQDILAGGTPTVLTKPTSPEAPSHHRGGADAASVIQGIVEVLDSSSMRDSTKLRFIRSLIEDDYDPAADPPVAGAGQRAAG